MRKNPIRLVEFVVGSSLALIALTNCFNVLSSSTTVTALPAGDATRIEQSKRNQHPLRFSSSGSASDVDSLFESNGRGALMSPAALAITASAVSRVATPFAPSVTATKSHMLPPGDTQADPGDTLTYTVVITNSGSTDATGVNFSDTIDPNTTLVPGSLAASPIAVDDSYHTIGNVHISVPVAQGVIANDLNPNGSGTLTVTMVNATVVPNGGSATASTTNGSVTMSSDGSFTYNPNVAFRGPSDSFTYTLGNGTGKTDTATVTIAVNGLIWFVNASAAPGGDGRLSSPFNCLVGSGCFDPVAADIANDNIFVYSGAYIGGLTLLSGQKLIGQGAGDSLLNITGLTQPSGTNMLPSTGGANPTIASSSANITLGSGNTIRGVTLGGSAAAAVDLAGTVFGTVTIAEVTLSGTGQALNLTNGTLSGPVASTAAFQSISSLLSSTTGISLTSVGGNMSSVSTSVTSSTGIGISVNTSGATLNFGATTSTLSGGTGVSLIGNTGAITFGTLNISPGANQKGLLATDDSNTITTTGGAITTLGSTAVEITRSSSTTPLNVTLTSITSTGGTAAGILLQNTSGSLTVDGDGTNTTKGGNASGGIIANIDDGGTDNSGSVGTGVFLNNASNVTLRRMQLNDHKNFGIRGLSVTGFNLQYTTINGSNGDTTVGPEGPVAFGTPNPSGANGLIGSGTIDNCKISGGIEHNLEFYNQSGNLNALTISNSDIKSNSTTLGGDGIQMEMDGTASVTVSVQTCVFDDNRSQAVQASALGSSSVDLTINACTVTRTTQGSEGFVLQNGANAHLTTHVTNNNISGIAGTTIFVGQVANNATNSSNLVAVIKDNVVTQPNPVTNRAVIAFLSSSAGQSAPANILIDNNNVTSPSTAEIIFVSTPDANRSPNFTATVTNNIITNTDSTGGALRSMAIQSTQTTSVGCFDVRSNVITYPNEVPPGPPPGVAALRVRQAGGGVANLEQGASAGTAATVLAANNPGAVTEVVGTVTVVANNFCQPTPPEADFEINSALQSNSATDESSTGRASDDPVAVLGQKPAEGDVVKLSQAELSWMAQAAIESWRQAGISAEELARLQTVSFEVADLADGKLAEFSSSRIKIDETAAGYGWFFDQTPTEDSEFEVPVPGRELHATDLSPAHGKMDLLTVVLRELGQVYLDGKKRVPKTLRPLMEPTLSPSVRRMPTFNIPARSASRLSPGAGPAVDRRIAAQPRPEPSTSTLLLRTAMFNRDSESRSASYARSAKRVSYTATAPGGSYDPLPFSGETVNLSVGTIPAGKSVTIMFQVTINNPLPSGVCSVTNVGHVTGTNFSPVDTNSDVTPIANAVAIGACPANITKNTDPGVCTAVVTYSTPTGTGCPVPTVTCNPPSGFAFPKGTTTVTCTASNGNPPDATCTFTVTVKDAEAPTCNLPANITTNTDPGQCSAVVNYTATASDNCPGATIVCNPASGSTFQKGTTTVDCTASDTSPDSPDTNCSFTVTVNDNQSPTIGPCPDPVVTNTSPGQCSAVVNYVTPNASDNCPGVTVACNPPTGTAFPKGTTTVTCTATDTSNHTASCSFTVTVNDNQPPSITCPGNINATEDSPGSGCATVNYPAPTVSDNCPGATFNCSPAPGFCFPIGTTTVTCTATDTSNNQSQCQFTVTVTASGLTALSPAKLWIGLKNSDDVGTKFDLLAEVLKNGMVVGSGELDDVPGGSSGFNNAVLRTITLGLSSAVPMGPGDMMSFRLSVRIAATSGHNSGTVRLWYNGAAIDSGANRDAGSRFDATIAGSTSDYFLRSPGFFLDTTAGSSRTFADKLASNSGGNPWQVVGTWTKTF